MIAHIWSFTTIIERLKCGEIKLECYIFLFWCSSFTSITYCPLQNKFITTFMITLWNKLLQELLLMAVENIDLAKDLLQLQLICKDWSLTTYGQLYKSICMDRISLSSLIRTLTKFKYKPRLHVKIIDFEKQLSCQPALGLEEGTYCRTIIRLCPKVTHIRVAVLRKKRSMQNFWLCETKAIFSVHNAYPMPNIYAASKILFFTIHRTAQHWLWRKLLRVYTLWKGTAIRPFEPLALPFFSIYKTFFDPRGYLYCIPIMGFL